MVKYRKRVEIDALVYLIARRHMAALCVHSIFWRRHIKALVTHGLRKQKRNCSIKENKGNDKLRLSSTQDKMMNRKMGSVLRINKNNNLVYKDKKI